MHHQRAVLIFRCESCCPNPSSQSARATRRNFRKCHSALSSDVSCIYLATGYIQQVQKQWLPPSPAPYAPSIQLPAVSQDVPPRQPRKAHRHLLPLPIPSLLNTLPSPARLSQSLTPLSPAYQDSLTHLNHRLTSTITIPRLSLTVHLLRKCQTPLQSRARRRRKRNSQLSRGSLEKSLGICAGSL